MSKCHIDGNLMHWLNLLLYIGQWYLTLCVSVEFPIMFDTVKPGWSIVYIEGSQVIIPKKIIFLSLKIDFALANSVNPDKMPHYAAFCQGLHCLPKCPFRGCWSTKG